jgi:hypothetical protein
MINMKRFMLLLSGILFSSFAICQKASDNSIDEESVTPPLFQTENTFCEERSIESIKDYLTYYLKEGGIYSDFEFKGTELVSFLVDVDGNLEDIRILNGLGTELDSEIIRLLNTTHGQWTPGHINGRPIYAEKEISLVFIPYEGYDLIAEAQKLNAKGNYFLFIKNNPRKALKCYNKACNLLPCQECLLSSRSMCKYKMGNKKGALEDCERILTTFQGQKKYGSMKPDDLVHYLYERF